MAPDAGETRDGVVVRPRAIPSDGGDCDGDCGRGIGFDCDGEWGRACWGTGCDDGDAVRVAGGWVPGVGAGTDGRPGRDRPDGIGIEPDRSFLIASVGTRPLGRLCCAY